MQVAISAAGTPEAPRHHRQRRPLGGMGGVAVAGDVPAAVNGQGQEGEMVPGAVVAQTLLGGAVRVPQRLRAEAAGLEPASHRVDVLVAALVGGAADGQRLRVQARTPRRRRTRPAAWAWNGFALERMVVRRCGSPCQATSSPAGVDNGHVHAWRLSSSSPRTTVTVISAYRTGMPELPELEAFVLAQRERLCREPMTDVPVAHFATVKTIDPPLASLVGGDSPSVRPRAKRLLFETEDSGPVLMVHLMSAGRWPWGPGHPKSSVLAVRFEDDTELAMTEAGRKRRAGAWLLTPEAVAEQLAHLGPEPLDPAFDTAALKAALERTRTGCTRFCATSGRSPASGAPTRTRSCTWRGSSPYASGTSLTPEQLERLHAAIVAAVARPPSG